MGGAPYFGLLKHKSSFIPLLGQYGGHICPHRIERSNRLLAHACRYQMRRGRIIQGVVAIREFLKLEVGGLGGEGGFRNHSPTTRMASLLIRQTVMVVAVLVKGRVRGAWTSWF